MQKKTKSYIAENNCQQEELELELKEYLKVVKKRIWLIVLCVVITTSSTAVISYLFMKPVYEASTKLIVNKSTDAVGTQPALDLNVITMNIKLIDTYKEVIKTLAIMDKVVEKHPYLNMDANELIKKVKVSSVNNTQVMTLSVQDYSYEHAANIVNAVSQVFKEQIPKVMKVDNVTILNEAKLDATPDPVKPNRELNVAISLIVSLMVAFGISLLLEYLDDTIKTEDDVMQVLELPTLTMIAKIRESDLASPAGISGSIDRKGKPHATIQH